MVRFKNIRTEPIRHCNFTEQKCVKVQMTIF